MGATEKFDACIRSIHLAAADPDRWSDALAKIAGFTNAHSAAFVCTNPRTQQPLALHVHEIDPAAKHSYLDYYTQVDPWLIGFLRQHRTLDLECSISGEILASGHKFTRTEYYADFASRIGHRWLQTGIVELAESRFAYLGLYRRPHEDDFSARDRRRYDHLLPHLRQAFQTSQTLNSLSARLEAWEQALGALPTGVVMLDARGRIVETNRPARKILAARDGLLVRDGELAAQDPGSHRALSAMIASALGAATGADGGAAEGQKLRRPSGRRCYVVRTAPLPERDGLAAGVVGEARPAALVFVSDPEDSPEPPERLLHRLYGLTPAEARLALSLSAGNPLSAAAEACGITREAARTRLKRVFVKTDTHSQTALVRLILAGAGALGRNPSE